VNEKGTRQKVLRVTSNALVSNMLIAPLLEGDAHPAGSFGPRALMTRRRERDQMKYAPEKQED